MNPFSVVKIWVGFPEILVEYFNKLALFDIAIFIGKSIKVDNATSILERGRYACVCGEFSLNDFSVEDLGRKWLGKSWV